MRAARRSPLGFKAVIHGIFPGESRALAQMLERLGHSVADSVPEGVPAVVFASLMQIDGDGIALLSEYERLHGSRCRYVLMVGWPGVPTWLEAPKGWGILVTPVTEERLLSALAMVC
jgi:hypothetical protein